MQPQLLRHVVRHFHDDGFDHHLGAAHIKGGDDLFHRDQRFGIAADDQGVGRRMVRNGLCGDGRIGRRALGRDAEADALEDRDDLAGIGIVERNDADIVALRLGRVELHGHLARPGDRGGVTTQQDRVAGFRRDGREAPGAAGLALRAGRGVALQAVQDRFHLEGGDIAERDRFGDRRILVDRLDHPAHALQVRGIVDDHERVRVCVRGDLSLAVEHRLDLLRDIHRVHVVELDDLGHEGVGALAGDRRFGGGDGFRHDPVGVAAGGDGGEALDAERGEEDLEEVFRAHRRLRDDGDADLAHIGVGDERVARQHRDIGDERVELDIVKLQDVLVFAGGGGLRGCDLRSRERCGGSQKYVSGHWERLAPGATRRRTMAP